MMWWRAFAFAAALVTAADAQARPISTVGIRGSWHVVRSGNMDPESVHTYSDAALRAALGGKLIIDQTSARWLLPANGTRLLAGQQSFNKPCMHPRVRALGDDQYELLCRGDQSFSPGMTMLMDGTLVLMMGGAEFYLRKDQ